MFTLSIYKDVQYYLKSKGKLTWNLQFGKSSISFNV